MVCQNKERGEAALSKIRSATDNQNFHLEVCDLSSVSDINSFASRFSSMDEPLHVLVNNAGLLKHNLVTTSKGFELNFAVNVSGTYSMTESLLPLLEKAAPDARVITVSSGRMYTVHLTKDLQVALTEKWAEMYKNKGIGFYAMHPGWSETPGVSRSLPDFSKFLSEKPRSIEESTDTVIWLALQPKQKLVSGSFYFDRAEAPKHLMFAATRGSHALIDSIIDNLRSLSAISS